MAAQIAKVTGVLQLLAALPVLWDCLETRSLEDGCTIAAFALAVLKTRCNYWNTLLRRFDLTADKIEIVLRLGFAVALQLSEFLPGLRAAEEQQDDIGACPLQWMYCQLLLFKSSCGHNVEVSAFLGEMLKARRMKAQLDSWGNFPCSQTGGSTPVQSIPLAAQYNYWSCLGMVARLKEAIRLDPALADTNLPAYTRQEIAEAMDHVRCHNCQELSDKLLTCTGCLRAKYCSRGCQKKHWLNRHKRECASAASEEPQEA
ncbi:hypothetical protein WJX75_009745 [Coccomyxa subellipsoidea]